MGDLEDIEKMVNKRKKVQESFSKGTQKSGLASVDEKPVTPGPKLEPKDVEPKPKPKPVPNQDVEPGWRKKIGDLFGGK